MPPSLDASFKETLHCWNQHGTGRGFRDELIGQKPQYGRSFWSVMDRQENYLCGWCDLTYLVGRLYAIHHRHIDIEQDYIRP